jgi:hypothetical protein
MQNTNFILSAILVCFCGLGCQKEKDDAGQDGCRLSDMAACTRIEVLFESSAFEYLTRVIGGEEPFLFAPNEKEHLRSINKMVCNDRNAILAYARNLEDGRYTGVGAGRTKYRTRVVGYKNDEKILSFWIIDGAPIINKGSLLTENRDRYSFGGGFPAFQSVVDKHLSPYLMRSYCAVKLGFFGGEVLELLRDAKLPRPSEWCDVIARHMERLGHLPINLQGSIFDCPSAKTSHFALNAHCTAKSPSGTVLLFESKPGWNQHGGPELFSMDNHEPKGGLVLLNDGTMVFIRSHEDLIKLGWK